MPDTTSVVHPTTVGYTLVHSNTETCLGNFTSACDYCKHYEKVLIDSFVPKGSTFVP